MKPARKKTPARKNFLGFGKGAQTMSSSRLSKTAYRLGVQGKEKEFDKWLERTKKHDNLHSSFVADLRREYGRGESKRLLGTKVKPSAKPSSLLDDIARGQAGKPYAKLTSDQQATVRKLAAMASKANPRKKKRGASLKTKVKRARKTVEKRVTKAVQALKGNPAATIEGVLKSRYGVTRDKADPTTIIWAADHVAKSVGYPAAAKQLSALNRWRERMGKTIAAPAYGTKLFQAQAPKGKQRNPAWSITQGKAKAHVYETTSGRYRAEVWKSDGTREEHEFSGKNAFRAAASWARLRLFEVANPCRFKLHSRTPGRKRKNPEDTSARMYEKFHGTPSTEILEFVEEEHRHKYLFGLGPLISMKVQNVAGNKQAELTFPDPADSKAGDVVMLCCTEDGTQLVCVGGDQELPVDSLIQGFGMLPADFARDNALIGTVTEITYRTKKTFEKDGREDIDFYHELGKEGSRGVFPVLEYKTRSPHLVIVGGRYYIGKAEAALGNVSPGVIG